jgi:hypothetical protein
MDTIARIVYCHMANSFWVRIVKNSVCIISYFIKKVNRIALYLEV